MKKIKKTLISIEDSHPLGRLVDLDCFARNTSKSLSRKDLGINDRLCFICSSSYYTCMRENKHSFDEICDFINMTFLEYISDKASTLCDQAILRELEMEDKFGLVTRTTNGSHDDMNYDLMIVAKNSLVWYFKKMFKTGYQAKNLNDLLEKSREIGKNAEKKMFNATNGINCYKGIIFLLGISLISVGYTLKETGDFNDVFINIKELCIDIFDDFKKTTDTNGAKLFHAYGITGIRGIAHSGLTIIKNNVSKISTSSNDDDLRAILFNFILSIDDTVFIKRSQTYQNYLTIKEYLKTFNVTKKNDLNEVNRFCLKNHLSFGGAADLLICGIFFSNIQSIFPFTKTSEK